MERCLARFMPDMVQSVLSVLEQRQAQPAGSCAQTHARSCRQEYEIQQRSNPVQALQDQIQNLILLSTVQNLTPSIEHVEF